MNKDTKNNRLNGLHVRPFLFIGLAAVLAAWLVSSFLWQIMLISGESMEPSYHNGQFVLVCKTDRDFGTGDVVAFDCEALKAVLVKRIAACPGDRAMIRAGKLLVDGENSPEYENAYFSDAGLLAAEIQLLDGEYIVIGDNISESKDSRDQRIGVVSEKDIRGKVWPLVPLRAERGNMNETDG